VTTFRRVDDLRAQGGHPVPAYLFEPEDVVGGAVVLHGHSHAKEESLGLSARLAEAGIAALAIDLRGHGANRSQLDEGVVGDVEAAVDFVRRFGPAAVIGHSLGGRLALMSAADLAVAISPAIPTQVSPSARTMFIQFPSPSVREPYPGYVLDLLKKLGPPPIRGGPTLLVSARYDAPSIREGTRELAARLPRGEYREVEEELRPPGAFGHPVLDYLPYWLNHRQMLLNPEVLRIVPAWLGEEFARLPRQRTTARIDRPAAADRAAGRRRTRAGARRTPPRAPRARPPRRG